MQSKESLRVAICSFTVSISLCGGTRGAEIVDAPATTKIEPDDTLVYVGTYTGPKSKGIYVFKLQTEKQSENLDESQQVVLAPLGLAAEIQNPSFLEVDPKRRRLFAVTESGQFEGKPTGAVSAFSIDPATGKLALLNQQSSEGSGPCHLVMDKTGKNVLVANYSSGSVAVLPIEADGRLGEATDFVQHAGKSINSQRQEGPHAHCVMLDPANRFVFVCDLGLDKVLIYRFDAENGRLTPNEPAFASVKAGAGPRHMVFRPDGRFAYVINELDSTITAFAYNSQTGELSEAQTISSLPPDFDGPNTTAEIDIHPSGKYLYGSNRGHNSVVLFDVNPEKGTLTYVGDQSTMGKTPRNFGLDADGDHLLVANQDSGTILVCRIDGANGRLKPSGAVAESPTPVCVKFLPPLKSGR